MSKTLQMRQNHASLEALRKDPSDSLWAFNNTSAMRHNGKSVGHGVLIFNVKVDANEAQPVIVPETWVPVDLSQQVPKHLILQSTDFLKAHRTRALIAILDAEANELFNGEDQESLDACAELTRATVSLFQSDSKISESDIRDRTSTRIDVEKNQERIVMLNPKLAKALAKTRSDGNPDGDITGSSGINMRIVEMSTRDDLSDEAVMNILRRMHEQTPLTSQDFNFILTNFVGMDRTHRYANDQLAKMNRF